MGKSLSEIVKKTTLGLGLAGVLALGGGCMQLAGLALKGNAMKTRNPLAARDLGDLMIDYGNTHDRESGQKGNGDGNNDQLLCLSPNSQKNIVRIYGGWIDLNKDGKKEPVEFVTDGRGDSFKEGTNLIISLEDYIAREEDKYIILKVYNESGNELYKVEDKNDPASKDKSEWFPWEVNDLKEGNYLAAWYCTDLNDKNEKFIKSKKFKVTK